jgi:hypothetical protein
MGTPGRAVVGYRNQTVTLGVRTIGTRDT